MGDTTRKILDKIRSTLNEGKNQDTLRSELREDDNFLTRSKILMEEAEQMVRESAFDKSEHDGDDEFPINKHTPQFGDVRKTQEDALVKTIGESIELSDKALIYYPGTKDLVLNGKINSLNIAFQFRYNDPSGDGCYIWSNGLQLTEANSRTLGKVRDAFLNWKQGLVQNGDLMEKLHQASTKGKNH